MDSERLELKPVVPFPPRSGCCLLESQFLRMQKKKELSVLLCSSGLGHWTGSVVIFRESCCATHAGLEPALVLAQPPEC